MDKKKLKKIIKEEIKNILCEVSIPNALKTFQKDNPNSKIYEAESTGETFTVEWTDKKWKDGVPITKYFDRNSKKKLMIKRGTKFWILETKYYWYFMINDIWYAVSKKIYLTPPFNY